MKCLRVRFETMANPVARLVRKNAGRVIGDMLGFQTNPAAPSLPLAFILRGIKPEEAPFVQDQLQEAWGTRGRFDPERLTLRGVADVPRTKVFDQAIPILLVFARETGPRWARYDGTVCTVTMRPQGDADNLARRMKAALESGGIDAPVTVEELSVADREVWEHLAAIR